MSKNYEPVYVEDLYRRYNSNRRLALCALVLAAGAFSLAGTAAHFAKKAFDVRQTAERFVGESAEAAEKTLRDWIERDE